MSNYSEDPLDNKIREGLKNHTIQPSEALWQKIASHQMQEKRGKGIFYKWLFFPAIAIIITGISTYLLVEDKLTSSLLEENINYFQTQREIDHLMNISIAEKGSIMSEDLHKENGISETIPPVIRTEEAELEFMKAKYLTGIPVPSFNEAYIFSGIPELSIHVMNQSVNSIPEVKSDITKSVKNKLKLELGLHISNNIPFVSNLFDDPLNTSGNLLQQQYGYSNSRGYGLDAGLFLNDKVKITAGVSYLSFGANYSVSYSEEEVYYRMKIDTNLRMERSTNKIRMNYDTTITVVKWTVEHNLAGGYSMDFISIPLYVSYDFININKLSMSGLGGYNLKMLLNRKGTRLTGTMDKPSEEELILYPLKKFNHEILAGTSVNYRIYDKVKIFVAPVYHFTIFDDNPYVNLKVNNLSVLAGIRKKF
jgi:hypothetical protein